MFDPDLARYSSTGIQLDAYHVFDTNSYGLSGELLKNSLIHYSNFVPGVAATPDLVPDVYITQSRAPVLTDTPDRVVGNVESSSVKFFTGGIF
jgi:hypothetical protein